MSETRNDEDIIRLKTCNQPLQAHLIRGVLEDEGIQCRVVGDMLGSAMGNLQGMQSEVWVHRGDLPRAVEALRNAGHHDTSEDQPVEGAAP